MFEPVIGETSQWILVVAAVSLFGIGGIKGVVGFGTGLFAVPLMSQLFSPELALGLLTITLWLGNVQLVAEDGIPRRMISTYRGHFVATIIGAFIGYGLFTLLTDSIFYIILGAYITVYLFTRNFSLPSQITPLDWPHISSISGGIGGALMGAFLSGGPVYVSYYQSLGITKREFTACLGFATTLGMGVRLLPLVAVGEFTLAQMAVGAVLFVPLAVGISVGARVRTHIPVGPFNRLVEGLLVIVALNLFYEGFGAFLQ